jgi:hypothetical protein
MPDARCFDFFWCLIWCLMFYPDVWCSLPTSYLPLLPIKVVSSLMPATSYLMLILLLLLLPKFPAPCSLLLLPVGLVFEPEPEPWALFSPEPCSEPCLVPESWPWSWNSVLILSFVLFEPLFYELFCFVLVLVRSSSVLSVCSVLFCLSCSLFLTSWVSWRRILTDDFILFLTTWFYFILFDVMILTDFILFYLTILFYFILF